jgi:hypothetical protein
MPSVHTAPPTTKIISAMRIRRRYVRPTLRLRPFVPYDDLLKLDTGNAKPVSNIQRHVSRSESQLLISQTGEVPKNMFVGFQKQGIQGAENQSLATRLEVGFLGSLCPADVSAPLLLNFLEPE